MTATGTVREASAPPVRTEFDALGGSVAIEADGAGAAAAAGRAEASLQDLQRRLTRFDAGSELCRLNSDPRETVPSSPIMVRFAATVALAGNLSRGLVDATCLDEIERAGYVRSLGSAPVGSAVCGLAAAAAAPGERVPGGGDPRQRWISVTVDPVAGTVTRPPGTRLDSGGTGKGLAADVAAEELEGLDCFAVNCVGDIRFGGRSGVEREIRVDSPVPGDGPVATLRLVSAAVATSGISRRSWIDPDGRVAHHLIDPATGRPAWTGVVQATAVAPTGVEAEVRAKAALLSGPDAAAGWLIHGGVIVLDDNRVIPVPGDAATVEAVR